MPHICKICKEPVINDRHFYQKHKMTSAEYYIKYFPRKDLLTNKDIPFKNKIQYFTTYFLSKSNMKKWILKIDKKEFIIFFKKSISIRHKIKKLKKPLGEAELESLNNFPSLNLILDKISFKEYIGIHKELDIKEYTFTDYSFKNFKKKLLEIGIDTREQYPFKYKNSRPFKMDYGDYTALGENFENVFVDRKSDKDFISTFGGGINRFKKEIKRANSFGAYLIVLIEKNAETFVKEEKALFRYTKCSLASIFHNMRDIMQENNNIQFLFTSSREEAERCLPKILSNGKKVKEIDLQFLYNKGVL